MEKRLKFLLGWTYDAVGLQDSFGTLVSDKQLPADSLRIGVNSFQVVQEPGRCLLPEFAISFFLE